MDDRYRGDDPRRSVCLASSANNGATRDRAPLPLGVNERTRGVGSRPMNGNGVRPGNGVAPHPEFRPPARAAASAPVYRGPRTPRSQSAHAPQTHPTGRPSSRVRAQNQPSRDAGQRRPLNGSYALTSPLKRRPGSARGIRRRAFAWGPQYRPHLLAPHLAIRAVQPARNRRALGNRGDWCGRP